MKITGTVQEIETLMSDLPGAMGRFTLPPSGYTSMYKGIRIGFEIWNQPTVERRKNTCYNCKLFLADACDGDNEDIRNCADYSDCWEGK